MKRLNFVFRIKFVTNQGHYLSIYLPIHISMAEDNTVLK